MNIKQNWERLFKHWADKKIEFWNSDDKLEKFTVDTKCDGADNSELDKIKNYYTNIPNELLESLTICNESNRWFGFNNWGLLYGIDKMLETSKSFENSPKDNLGSYETVGQGIVNPAILLPKEWIPIYDYNGDYIVVVDMLSKNKGQIIIFSLEFSTLAKWANSYEEWLEMAVDEVLQYGELRAETIEEVLF